MVSMSIARQVDSETNETTFYVDDYIAKFQFAENNRVMELEILEKELFNSVGLVRELAYRYPGILVRTNMIGNNGVKICMKYKDGDVIYTDVMDFKD